MGNDTSAVRLNMEAISTRVVSFMLRLVGLSSVYNFCISSDGKLLRKTIELCSSHFYK